MQWIINHPDDTSIVVTGGAPGGQLHWNADVERPLASTFKTIVLAAYAREVAAGRIDPERVVPVEDVERWLVEGTDGGSHAAMLEQYATPAGIRVDDLAAAMMVHSANTATDALLHLIGRPAIVDTAAELGLPRVAAAAAPPAGALGLLTDVALGATPSARLDALLAMGAESADRAAWDGAAAFAEEPERTAASTLDALADLSSWDEQLRLAEALPWQGRPIDMHGLVVRLVVDGGLGATATDIVRAHMSWPMQDAGIAARFSQLVAKEGASPGTLVVHGSGRPRAGAVAGVDRTVVLSVHRLAPDLWIEMYQGESFHALALELLADPGLVAALRSELER